jgi:hypothetical protein
MDIITAVTLQTEHSLEERRAYQEQRLKNKDSSFKEQLVENLHVLYDFFTDKQRE